MTGAVRVIPLSVITGAGLPMIIVPVSPVRSVAVKPVGMPSGPRPLNVIPAILVSTVGVKVSSFDKAAAVADWVAEGEGIATVCATGVLVGPVTGAVTGAGTLVVT